MNRVLRFGLLLSFFAAVIVVWMTTTARAQFPRHHDVYDPAFEKWAMSEVRAVVEKNFAAVNAEDVESLMDTHTSYCPDREEFRSQAKQAFEDFDVYVRLVDLQWGGGSNASSVYAGGHRCSVIVTQQTMPANAEDGDYTSYRANSALLPEAELVRYNLHCHMEGGKWKIHMINGNINPTTWEFFQDEQVERAKNSQRSAQTSGASPFDCSNGRCETPALRVRD